MKERRSSNTTDTTSGNKCEKNINELNNFLKSNNTINRLSEKSQACAGVETTAQLAHDSNEFEKEGDTLERSGEHALALACYTKAASLSKRVCELESVLPDERLRGQIKREGCLKKARGVYRKMLVQSVQNPKQPVSRKSKKTKQVCSEKRPCTSCGRMVFWVKAGDCSDCNLKKTEEKSQKSNKSEKPKLRDFTTPRTHNSSKRQVFLPLKSCVLCSVNCKR